jgi:hypothetical protein
MNLSSDFNERFQVLRVDRNLEVRDCGRGSSDSGIEGRLAADAVRTEPAGQDLARIRFRHRHPHQGAVDVDRRVVEQMPRHLAQRGLGIGDRRQVLAEDRSDLVADGFLESLPEPLHLLMEPLQVAVSGVHPLVVGFHLRGEPFEFVLLRRELVSHRLELPVHWLHLPLDGLDLLELRGH